MPLDLFFKKCLFWEKRPAGGNCAPDGELVFSKSVFFEKNDPPEATAHQMGNFLFQKVSFLRKTTRRRQVRTRWGTWFSEDGMFTPYVHPTIRL